VLAIDIGTSSVRALAYDASLHSVPGAEAHLPHHPRLTADGGAELDYRSLRASVLSAVDRVLSGAPRAGFAAVGISSFWHGLVAADRLDKPLTPVYLWSDGRAWREAEALRRRLDERRLHQRTGCRLHPSYWPAKIAWLRRADRRLRGRQVRWLSPADLLSAELLGRSATSASLASATGVRQLRRPAWDGPLLEALGLRLEALPEVADAPGVLSARWRKRWPQLAEAIWAPVLGDGAAANLGSGCLDVSRRALTVGTSAALRVTLPSPPRTLPYSLWCYQAGPGRFVTGGALSNGGNLFEWLRQTLAVGDVDAALRSVARSDDGFSELTFLPLLAGERSPGYALHATGAIAGLTQATTAVDLLGAGLAAIAVQLARLDRDLDRIAPSSAEVIASGAGLLADPGWMRMICDALGKPLRAGHAKEASARGAALVALEAAGLAPTRLAGLDPGAGRPVKPDRSPAVRERYAAAMSRQDALYRVLVTGRLLEAKAPPTPAHLRRLRVPRE